MSDEEIEKFTADGGWAYASYTFYFTANQIDKYSDKLDWKEVSWRQSLTLEQIKKYKDKIYPQFLLENFYIDKSIRDKIEFGVFYD